MANSRFSSFLKKNTATCLLVLFLLDIFLFFLVVVVSKCGGQKEIPIQAQSYPSPKRLL